MKPFSNTGLNKIRKRFWKVTHQINKFVRFLSNDLAYFRTFGERLVVWTYNGREVGNSCHKAMDRMDISVYSPIDWLFGQILSKRFKTLATKRWIVLDVLRCMLFLAVCYTSERRLFGRKVWKRSRTFSEGDGAGRCSGADQRLLLTGSGCLSSGCPQPRMTAVASHFRQLSLVPA